MNETSCLGEAKKNSGWIVALGVLQILVGLLARVSPLVAGIVVAMADIFLHPRIEAILTNLQRSRHQRHTSPDFSSHDRSCPPGHSHPAQFRVLAL